MPVTTKKYTVYVAEDGTEFCTYELAAKQNQRRAIMMLLDKDEFCTETRYEIADFILRHWLDIRVILSPGSLCSEEINKQEPVR